MRYILLIALIIGSAACQSSLPQSATPATIRANHATSTPRPTIGGIPTPSSTNTPPPTVIATLSPTVTPALTDTPSSPAVTTASPATTPAMADIDLIVDNRDAAFSTTGWWFIGDGGQSYNGDCAWTPPGTRNIAYVQPESLQVGAYEIFAWWCGNPNRDQIGAALIQIHPTGEQTSPYQVYVNLQENAGLWNSVGTYYLEPGASLSIHSDFDGNVVADAFRFSYRSPEQVVITPTPRPTAFPWTNHPPTPLDQLTQGDLSARLGLVEPYYQRSPVIVVEEHTFDDCQTFPRDGCSGVREGWQVQVQYQDIMITYRVSEDYHFVALEPSAALAARQRLYLAGWDNNELLRFRVDRYPDDTWHISGKNYEGTYTSQTQLDAETLESLQALVQSYSSLRFQTPEGIDLILFGLGEGVELSEADQSRLAALAVKLAAIALAER